MREQLTLLGSTAGRQELWFHAVDLLGRRVADVPVHDCEGGWSEASHWCALAVAPINSAIRLAWGIETAACEAAGLENGRAFGAPCCKDSLFDRHDLAHRVAHLRPPSAAFLREPPPGSHAARAGRGFRLPQKAGAP